MNQEVDISEYIYVLLIFVFTAFLVLLCCCCCFTNVFCKKNQRFPHKNTEKILYGYKNIPSEKDVDSLRGQNNEFTKESLKVTNNCTTEGDVQLTGSKCLIKDSKSDFIKTDVVNTKNSSSAYDGTYLDSQYETDNYKIFETVKFKLDAEDNKKTSGTRELSVGSDYEPVEMTTSHNKQELIIEMENITAEINELVKNPTSENPKQRKTDITIEIRLEKLNKVIELNVPPAKANSTEILENQEESFNDNGHVTLRTPMFSETSKKKSMRIKREKNMQCPYCLRMYHNQNAIRSHIYMVHKSLVPEDGLFKPLMASTVSNVSNLLPKYEFFKPRITSTANNTFEQFDYQKKESKQNMICPWCPQNLKFQCDLQQHIKEAHGIILN